MALVLLSYHATKSWQKIQLRTIAELYNSINKLRETVYVCVCVCVYDKSESVGHSVVSISLWPHVL